MMGGIDEGGLSAILSKAGRDLAAAGDAGAYSIDHGTYFTNLPQEFYLSETLFKAEIRKVFSRQWLYAGQTSQIPNPGDYYTRDIGPESLIIARDLSGRIRAYFNVCRHRGSRICDAGAAGNTKVFVCPYHSWSYGIDGALRGAPGARSGKEFNFADWGLHEAHCDSYFGSIFVYLAKETPPQSLDALLSASTVDKAKLAEVQPERTKIAARRVYEMNCNWKTLLENAGECYHCQLGHPTLAVSINIAATFLGEDGQFQPEAAQGLFPFNPGMRTISADGNWVSRKPLGTPQAAQFSTGYITFPNFCGASYYADYGTVIVIEPISVNRTRMFCEWMVHEDAVAGLDYDIEHLVAAWDKTNIEDITLAERNFKGTQSMRFTPGPHVIRREAMVRTALVGYLDLMNAPDAVSVPAESATCPVAASAAGGANV